MQTHQMGVLLRRARPNDAEEIIASHVRSIREVCKQDYTPEQISAWSGRDFKTETWHRTMDEDCVWIAENEGRVCGFGHLVTRSSEGEIQGLYLAPEIIRQGVGGRLLKLMLSEARKQGVKRIKLNSTLTARRFYENHGFTPGQESCRVAIGGVQIPCIPMEMSLTEQIPQNEN